MLAVNGHAKHRQSLCRVGYGKTALSMDLFFITTANILSTHTFLLLSLEFALRIPLAAAGVLAITHNKKMHSSELGAFSYVLLRKEWDSNPRYTKSVRRISSPVHSITLASFQCKSTTFRFLCKRNSWFFKVTSKVRWA